MVNTVYKIIRESADQLAALYEEPTGITHAWWLLEKVTQQSKSSLIAQQTFCLSDEQQNQLDDLIHQHIHEHVPLAYLIGSVPFGELTITVQPPVLIPRPETEEWIYQCIDELQPVKNKPLVILDLCTGSGCIALALARALPYAHIYATDICERAVALTQQNARLNNITNVIAFTSDLFASIDPTLKFDIIVVNPPYLSPDVMPFLDQSVTRWEDHRALTSPHGGTAIMTAIARQASAWLNQTSVCRQYDIPQLIMEIGYDQGMFAHKLLENEDFIAILKKDLAGFDRVIKGKKRSSWGRSDAQTSY